MLTRSLKGLFMSQTPANRSVAHHTVLPFEALDPATPFGQMIVRRLQEERLIWLTTIDQSGVPQPLL